MIAETNPHPGLAFGPALMTNSLHFSEWRNCIRAQRKVNLCAPGAPKGPKVGMFVRQYEIVCANDAGRVPRMDANPNWMQLYVSIHITTTNPHAKKKIKYS